MARVPITRHHNGNAIYSSQDIYHGHYIRQRSGPCPRGSPAQPISEASTLPAPAPAAAAAFPPFLLPRGELQVANPTNLAIHFCKITHKDLPFAPRALLRRQVPCSQGHKVPLLSSRVCTQERLGLFVFSCPVQRPGNLKPGRRYSPPTRSFCFVCFHKACTTGKIKFRKAGKQPLGANTESRSAQNTNTTTARNPATFPLGWAVLRRFPSPRTLNSTAGANAHPFPTPTPKSPSRHKPLSPGPGEGARGGSPTP